MSYQSEFSDDSKLNKATILTLATGLLLTRAGENFGLLGASKRASHGPVAFDRFAQELVHSKKEEFFANSLFSNVSKNARIVLISDFLRPLPEIENIIKAISKNGCHGVLLHMADPAEIELPFNGRVRFDAMNEDISLTVGRTEAVRDEYQSLFSKHRTSVQSLAQKASWDYIFYRTDHFLWDPLAALFHSLQWRG